MYGLSRISAPQVNDPFSELARQLFSSTPSLARQTVAAPHAPRFDLIESPTSYVLRGDLPGVSDADLDISVHEGILSLRGTRADETVNDDSNFVLRERSFGEFERRLRLPKNADANQIEAKLANGVLTVSIAKKEELQARKIKIG